MKPAFAMLFALFTAPAFAGLFDDATDDYQEATEAYVSCQAEYVGSTDGREFRKQNGCRTDSDSLQEPATQECFLQLGKKAEMACHDEWSAYRKAGQECIKEGFSQQQCDAARQLGGGSPFSE